MSAKPFFHIMIVADDDAYTPQRVRDLLLAAEKQGHPLGAGSYLEQMSVRQLDALVHGRSDT